MDYLRYLRIDKLPHIWCEGCGNGIVLKSLLRVIDELKLDPDKTVIVSGIGCSSRTPGYMDFNTLHTTHGRAIAYATGIKLAKPELEVIVITGDGDATAIGGNHFIHAARRNINITVLIYNNYIYGMTGGQVSPTTPLFKYTTTTPYGNPEQPFDISKLAKAAGASFVARTTVYHFQKMDTYIKKAILKKGFSVVEIITPCPTAFGRKNKEDRGIDMLKKQREIAVPIEKAKNLSSDELKDKIIIGIFQDIEKEEYTDLYKRIREEIKNNNKVRL